MRTILQQGTLLLFLLIISNLSFGQDFSNKGKDFWVGYGYHERMTAGGGGSQNMVLYFATEAYTNVTVSIPGTGYEVVYSIPANTIFTSAPIPKTGVNDARLNTEGVSNRGIHITSDKPIVAYAHIYNQSVSGATLLFPTNTLGKEYYSMNYEQISNSNDANCWMYAIAVDPGITTIEITPSQPTLTHAAGVPFTVNLNQGQVINLMGQLVGQSGDIFRGVDLTGSRIRTISSGTEGCKRIAVFSGSGRIALVCDGAGSGQKSSDNYMVQAVPKNAWGKNYLTVPTAQLTYNVFRIGVDDPATQVRVNGVVQTNLQQNFYYQVEATDQPLRIESDKPVMVAQYISTGRFCGNRRSGDLGDPEVIYLSPIEQTINRVILNSTSNYAIQEHYVNVTIPTQGTAISSFRLDGQLMSNSFTPHPQNPAYSYARIQVSAGQHILQSDSGFNAVAYGYGEFESYGYNAGSNVKDLYQFVSVENELATVDFPAACKGDPFSLYMTFPYQPTRIEWKFNGLFPDVAIDNPVFTSTSVVNGRTLYRYSLAGSYTAPAAGTYPIRVMAQNPTADGCNGMQEIDYDLEIYNRPAANFNFTSNGCINSPVSFSDASPASGRPAAQWYWNFADGNTNTTGSTASHTYASAGNYTVRYAFISDVGCMSDTVSKQVNLIDPPVAAFTTAGPFCAGKTIRFTDASTIAAGNTINRWVWNFGDGSSPVVATSNAAQAHTYTGAGSYTVTLQVESSTGCVSTVFSSTVQIYPDPVASFNLPGTVCLPAGTAQFSSTSTIADGTEAQFTYAWNFGDGSAIGAGATPTHQYTGTGPYQVQLTVTSARGCEGSATQTLSTVFSEPEAAFTVAAEVCLGNNLTFTDQSTAASATVTQWQWDFGDGTTSAEKNPVKVYSTAGTYTVTLRVTTDKGCATAGKTATQTVQVLALPVAGYQVQLPGCVGQAVRFTSNATTAAGNIIKWTWNYGDNTGITQNAATPQYHIYTSTGSYTTSLQVETDKGCVSTVNTAALAIHPTPAAAFEPPVICVNDRQAPFADNSTISGGTISAWQWNFGDANATGINPNIATTATASHHYSLPGMYTVELITTSNLGCSDTTQRTFQVNGAVLTPAFTLENATTAGIICSNNELRIKDATQIDYGKFTRIDIFWDATDPASVQTDPAPYPGKVYSHQYNSFGSPASRTYRIRYNVYSGITCVNTFEKEITLLAAPQLVFDQALPVCSNAAPVQLNGQLQNTMNGFGTFSGVGVNNNGLFYPAQAGAGLHTITYTYEADNGCKSLLSRQIEVYPTPQANAGPDKVVLEGGQVQLTPQLISNIPVTYTWSPATGLNDAGVASPYTSPSQDMIYTLTVRSDRGCETSDQVAVKLLLKPVIPNIFSPNGDGINDRWVIEHLESYPGCIIQLFNRYGQQVLKMVNYTTPWDGKINGKDAPVGTYYYIIDPRNGRQPMTGYVDIIR